MSDLPQGEWSAATVNAAANTKRRMGQSSKTRRPIPPFTLLATVASCLSRRVHKYYRVCLNFAGAHTCDHQDRMNEVHV
jgi:hypothetical protein